MPVGMDWCAADKICTQPMFEGSNICAMDDGGPLYKLACETRVPECLYGVVSHSRSKYVQGQEFQRCNGGSFFANVPRVIRWIVAVIGSSETRGASPANYEPIRVLEVPRPSWGWPNRN